MSATPDLRCFPSADAAFAAFVRRCARNLERAERLTPAGLQAAVRDRYPTARVSVQEGMARDRDEPLRWYAYRDTSPWAPDFVGD